MNEMYIVSFNSTHHAIRTDKLFGENSIKSTTLPTPREITASCGISIRFLHNDLDNVNSVLKDNNIEFKGIYHIKKIENGQKEVNKIG
ncbi:MAG: DUF3343 domain-containing protein [Peptostreptococcaceae bacterium]